MRISDWSSDVCSSDLHQAEAVDVTNGALLRLPFHEHADLLTTLQRRIRWPLPCCLWREQAHKGIDIPGVHRQRIAHDQPFAGAFRLYRSEEQRLNSSH